MLGRNTSEPALFQMVDVEALVPAGHLLRRVDAVLDLSFVREAVAECYSDGAGRPSIDPELAVRMMLLGELYDIGDRELCDEIGMHAGMRWFCRLNFHDPVPDHSTLSPLRNERWAESGLFDRLMDEVIRQCCEAGLVSGRHLSVDGTEMRADASMKSLERRGPQPTPPDPPGPPGSGSVRGQEPKPAGEWEGRGVRYRNDTHVSSTDPDARLYRKGDSREARLSYLVHDLIDTKSRVILGRRASLATGAAEREMALEMLDDVLERREELGLEQRPEILTGDANYGASDFVTDVLARDVVPHVPLLAGEAIEEIPTWTRPTCHPGLRAPGHRGAGDRLVLRRDGSRPEDPQPPDRPWGEGPSDEADAPGHHHREHGHGDLEPGHVLHRGGAGGPCRGQRLPRSRHRRRHARVRGRHVPRQRRRLWHPVLPAGRARKRPVGRAQRLHSTGSQGGINTINGTERVRIVGNRLEAAAPSSDPRSGCDPRSYRLRTRGARERDLGGRGPTDSPCGAPRDRPSAETESRGRS